MTSWQGPSTRRALRVHPFRGVTFSDRAGDLSDLTFTPPTSWSSLPADLLGRIPANHILHLLAPAFGGHAQSGAERARAQLTGWLDNAVLHSDREPAIYVYAQPGEDADVVGVIATVELLPADADPFLAHEEVIAPLVDVQEILEQTTHAQIEPILALYRDTAALHQVLSEIVSRPADLSVTEQPGRVHRLWRVSDPEVHARIAAAMPGEPALIADGHHRHAAWSRVAARTGSGPATRALALLVGAGQPGMRLGAIHRIIPGLDLGRAIESEAVDSRQLADRAAAAAYLAEGPIAGCVLHSRGAYYAVTPRERSSECAAPDLAVCHLHTVWLQRWAVPEADIAYVHEFGDAVAATSQSGVAALLPAPKIADVIAAAYDGRPLPRKATSFGPKPLVGTVFRTWLTS